MPLASVIKTAFPLLVQWCLLLPTSLWCLLLPTSFFVSDVVAWQTHNSNPVTTGYLLDLSYYHSL